MAVWSESDLAFLMSAVNEGQGWNEIGKTLNRSPGACKSKYQNVSQPSWNLVGMEKVEESGQPSSTNKRDTRARKPTEKALGVNNKKVSLREMPATSSSKTAVLSSGSGAEPERSRRRTDKILAPQNATSKIVKGRSRPRSNKEQQAAQRRPARSGLESDGASSSEEETAVKPPSKPHRKRQIATKTMGGRRSSLRAARKSAPSYWPRATDAAAPAENNGDDMELDEEQPDAIEVDAGAGPVPRSNGWTEADSFHFLRLFLAGASIDRMQIAFPRRNRQAIVEHLGVLWEKHPTMGATSTGAADFCEFFHPEEVNRMDKQELAMLARSKSVHDMELLRRICQIRGRMVTFATVISP